MSASRAISEHAARIRSFIETDGVGGSVCGRLEGTEAVFNALALGLFRVQFEHIPVYRGFCRNRGISPERVERWEQIPPLPVGAFKEAEVSVLDESERLFVFHSSSTTGQKPSRHFHDAASLGLYEASLVPGFEGHLLPDRLCGARFVSLTPPPSRVPRSSLAYMLDVVGRRFGSGDSVFTGHLTADGEWDVDCELSGAMLREAIADCRPVVVLGTAFNFVQLADSMARANAWLRLAPGSRVMETGGYKGKSRSLPKLELHRLLGVRLGLAGSHVISEYGMSELSSQAYDARVGETIEGGLEPVRLFRFPAWVRVQIISPENGREVALGETGLVRVFDLANAYSVSALQTEDLARSWAGGFELLGRADRAEPRGCSLMTRETYDPAF